MLCLSSACLFLGYVLVCARLAAFIKKVSDWLRQEGKLDVDRNLRPVASFVGSLSGDDELETIDPWTA